MTSDPTTHAPDDADTSLRIRALTEDAERRVQAVRDEHAALVGECQQLAARLGAALATAEALREELRQLRDSQYPRLDWREPKEAHDG